VVLGVNVGLWLEVVLMFLLPQQRFLSTFGPPSDTLDPEACSRHIETAWSTYRLPYFLLTSVMLHKRHKTSNPAFALTLALRGRGLTNTGSDVLATMGVTVSRSNFYRSRATLLQKLDTDSK
jgi:hypothetical protein